MEPTTARPHRIAELATRNIERNKQKSPGHLDGAEAGEPELHSLPKPAAVRPRHPAALTSVALGRACSRPNVRNQSGPQSLHPPPRHGTIPAWIIATCMRGERIWGTKLRNVGALKRVALFLATSFTAVGMNVRTKSVRETERKYHLCGLNSD